MVELTEEKKKQLKEKYGKLYITVLDSNDNVIWRPIKRSEHKKIILDTNTIESQSEMLLARQEATCKTCIVFPETQEEIDDLLESGAGISIVISDEIYRKSGFDIKKSTEEL